jgi:hypothetical protein
MNKSDITQLESLSIQLRTHIYKYCGETPDALFDKEDTGISVAKFNDIPDKGLTTYITIGLSGHQLKQESNRPIRQELMITLDSGYAARVAVEQVVSTVATMIVKSHNAVKNGEVIGPFGPLFPEDPQMNLTAIGCGSPAYFDEGFDRFDHNDELMVFVELVPLTTKEAKSIEQDGWDQFIDKISSFEIEHLDYYR